MSLARYLVGDVFDRLAELEDGSVDLVVTSPPFLALRSYLPADHPNKDKEIGSEPTPAAFIDVMLLVMAELRRVTAEHGSVCVELGDTYAGSGGAGGDYAENGMREGQPTFRQRSGWHRSGNEPEERYRNLGAVDTGSPNGGAGWPLAKSRTLIPELFRIALAYGINPLTGIESPAGKWLVRNVVTWCRPNPPVGALGDKWRPATSDVVVACTSPKRYWDDLATRKEYAPITLKNKAKPALNGPKYGAGSDVGRMDKALLTHAGAPLLDYWEIPPTGYSGAHYAVYPPALVEPLVKAMGPQRVCRTCGEPSRRIVSWDYEDDPQRPGPRGGVGAGREDLTGQNHRGINDPANRQMVKVPRDVAVSDCGHDNWRPGLILDPFAGSGTTLQVATGHGLDAIGIDLDERNAVLAEQRIGGLFFEVVGQEGTP